ncbi:MAG: hypothetical protein CM1200mP2_52120 [Planctomycetaceae bacterium]|nr:MAG: hypothetical protein CM1200mP2_52120 [Planctomycetaceae bacterium]
MSSQAAPRELTVGNFGNGTASNVPSPLLRCNEPAPVNWNTSTLPSLSKSPQITSPPGALESLASTNFLPPSFFHNWPANRSIQPSLL